MKYTVMINHGEFVSGLFDSKIDADKYRAKLIRSNEPDASKEMTDEEVLEEFDCDGYYRTVEITEANAQRF